MILSIASLWLPILLGAVAAWIASALIHVVIKYHNADYKALPNEDEVSAALRAGGAGPALYTFPYCSDMSQMNDESIQSKFRQGPVGMMTLMPSGMPPMGKLMAQQVAFFAVGCVLIAYCASLALPAGAGFAPVFRFVWSVGFLAFGWSTIPFSIWYGHPWANTARYLLDALIYGAVVAVIFAWLWPAAAGS